MSLEPAVAATAGLILLSQDLDAQEVVAIGLGAGRERRRARRGGDRLAPGGI